MDYKDYIIDEWEHDGLNFRSVRPPNTATVQVEFHDGEEWLSYPGLDSVLSELVTRLYDKLEGLDE